MLLNLIRDKWIAIRRRDGTKERIAPWEITSDYLTNPIVTLDAPRPDFNGALIQFLIGIVQTVTPPKDEEDWEDHLHEPPTPVRLEEIFSCVAHAFELGGNGPRFMQDFQSLQTEELRIANLLIETPGENALRNNTDHFIKRGGVETMCPPCCATALFALQTNAPSGGVGHRTSLRGGGPLTTVVLGDGSESNTLWQMVWLNVLEEDTFLRTCGNPAKTAEEDKFPWLAPTRTSEPNSGRETNSEDVHPAQMFWGMPRRIRLSLDDCVKSICDICGALDSNCIRAYRTKNYGVNYTGPWLHPLSPHTRKEGIPVPVHAQPGGVSYRHWLGLVQEDEKRSREPSRIVHHFRENRQKAEDPFRLWVFGYDMDKMKARCWYESTMPLIPLRREIHEQYAQNVAGMVLAASQVAGNLRACVKKAWFKRPSDVKGDTSFVDSDLWQMTEDGFYTMLNELRSVLEEGNEATQVMKRWHHFLSQKALSIFDGLAWKCPVEDADPKRVVLARLDLMKSNNSRRITVDLLGLPRLSRKEV